MNDQDGFTLIELMVVVLIIAILIAIAIPTFLGLRARAQDRAAQSDLRNGLTAAKTFYTDNETYVGFTAAAAGAIEPSLTWNAGATVKGQVSIHLDADTDDVLLVGQSLSDKFFCIGDNDGQTVTGQGTAAEADVATVAACAAAPTRW
jgi:type IV pilus assembly protein PilA